jgi:hypothetical protein
LPLNHRYRKNRKDFFVGRVEKDVASPHLLSMDMFSILKNTGKEERHTTTVFVLRDPLAVS